MTSDGTTFECKRDFCNVYAESQGSQAPPRIIHLNDMKSRRLGEFNMASTGGIPAACRRCVGAGQGQHRCVVRSIFSFSSHTVPDSN
jgi:hypothetical protein